MRLMRVCDSDTVTVTVTVNVTKIVTTAWGCPAVVADKQPFFRFGMVSASSNFVTEAVLHSWERPSSKIYSSTTTGMREFA
jgi:hypothetical protein